MTKTMTIEDEEQDDGADDGVSDSRPWGHRPREAGLELGVERLFLDVRVYLLDLLGPGHLPPQLPAC